jgi:putative MATE family efflux protein
VTSHPPAHGDSTAPDPGAAAAPEPAAPPGVFTQGSTLRHVLVMTATGSVGLVAIFAVDLLNLFYISLLGEQELAAAVGYAGTVLFFGTSIGIGLSIGVTALVSRALGARDREAARRLATSGTLATVAVMAVFSALMMLAAGDVVRLLGAAGRTHELATRFLLITLPSTPFLGLGMALSGVLRAVGDAQRAMWVTLSGGLVAAVADPLLIFALGLGFDGAAHATNLSRAVLGLVGLWGVVRAHDLLARPRLAATLADLGPLGAIAGPAILTNVATPVANGYLTAALAGYGDAAVAAWAVIGRVIPVAFGVVFALTGAVGPIIGQNLGARRFDRVRGALADSLKSVAIYTLAVWAAMFLGRDLLVAAFAASGEAAALIRFYCAFVAPTFLFMGALFVANAAFNTMGAPFYATAFNWGRATLGTIPFAIAGGALAGAEGVLLGQGLGGVVFGAAAAVVAFRTVDRLARAGPRPL